MAEINGDNINTVQANGEYGNQAASSLKATVNAAAVGDTIYFGDVAGGNEILRVTVYHGALGASATLDLGYRYKDSDDGTDDLDAFFSGEDVSAAGRSENAGDTVEIEPGDGVEIVGTIGGATTASSDIPVTVIVERIYRGQR